MTSTASGVRSVWGALFLAGLYPLILLVIATPAGAAGLPAGDIVVTAEISPGDSGLMLIDPTTGNRTILSDNTHGTGMPFDQPVGVSVLPSGELVVTDDGVSPLGPDSNRRRRRHASTWLIRRPAIALFFPRTRSLHHRIPILKSDRDRSSTSWGLRSRSATRFSSPRRTLRSPANCWRSTRPREIVAWFRVPRSDQGRGQASRPALSSRAARPSSRNNSADS